jgi:hypothetical protein
VVIVRAMQGARTAQYGGVRRVRAADGGAVVRGLQTAARVAVLRGAGGGRRRKAADGGAGTGVDGRRWTGGKTKK